MAASPLFKTLISIKYLRNLIPLPSSFIRHFISTAAAEQQPQSDGPSSSSFSFNDGNNSANDGIHLKAPDSNAKRDAASSVTMPMSFMTGSIVGKRYYKQVTTREADNGNGWTVMLDYRTL